ncbi:hypothetical protein E3N88_17269 [Mikania micrantha]|uniref:Integrase catalytic domain-containing protein n=1 Tax=Mikania micrantha TaxID=192012 RepID=A0A5N6NT63_9ASTR|nr:hypothetical protein E3N88_17269 [Mikania micrantha]
MYQDLRKDYWWPGMKFNVMQYVNKCLTCAQVKAEHQKPYGYVQPLEVPEWKWEHITMDFITKLPLTAKRHDTIWVIVDRLTKSAHFLPIRETYTSEKLSELFVKEIITRHGVPVSIVSDRDTRFVSRFWKQFHESMGTRLNISTAYHPQTDGQSERTIQTLEDMLRACIIDFGGSWDDHLPLVEFSYNNSYHASIGMPPYEALYGRRCRTPVCWGGVGQKEVGSKAAVLDLTEKLQLVKARMKAAQDRQKSYADKRRRPIEFEVGDQVLLKVSPWKGVIRFRKRGKLSPRFIGPFRIMARVGKVAYRLDLPDELSGIHPTFHVSHLRKCLVDDVAYVPLNDIEVDERLNYIEEPVAIVDTKEKQLRNKTIRQVKVQWKHRKGSEATWETEDEMKRLYPHLFEMRKPCAKRSYGLSGIAKRRKISKFGILDLSRYATKWLRILRVSTTVEKEKIILYKTLDRGRGGNVVLPAAVGQNLSTAVKGAASAYDGLNDLNCVMNMNDVCKEVLYRYEPSTSVDGLRVLWKHGPADCVSPVDGILCMWSAVDGEVPSLYK